MGIVTWLLGALPFPSSEADSTYFSVSCNPCPLLSDLSFPLTPCWALQHGGGLSEFAVVSENAIAPAPSSLPVAEAAAIPLAGMTALQGLKMSGIIKLKGSTWDGEGCYKGRVLVANATGGVGHFAVQVRSPAPVYSLVVITAHIVLRASASTSE